MDKNFEKELLKKFDTVIKLLTISSLKDETQLQKIKILSSAGLPPKDIADLLGTSSNTVSVALHKLKNKSKENTSKKEDFSDNETNTTNQEESSLNEKT
ncbi:MAG: hypothetical protein ABIH59_00845 [archaeon]